MEELLTGFHTELGTIGTEIQALQEQSDSWSTRHKNRAVGYETAILLWNSAYMNPLAGRSTTAKWRFGWHGSQSGTDQVDS